MQRRTFLTAGLAGSATLAAGGWWAVRAYPSDPRAAADAVLAAIVPAVLDGALPQEPGAHRNAIGMVVQRTRATIEGLAPAVQQELGELFGLLSWPPARRWLAGVKNDWPQASPAEVRAFLQSWRTHRFALMQSAYHALHDLITGAFYSDEASWATLGYALPAQLSA
jgi:hypothetical protein